MLDHLTVSSICFGDAPIPWRQDFGRGGHALVDFERFLSELSCGFSGCLFFLFLFFSFIFSLTFFFPFSFSVVTSNFFFF